MASTLRRAPLAIPSGVTLKYLFGLGVSPGVSSGEWSASYTCGVVVERRRYCIPILTKPSSRGRVPPAVLRGRRGRRRHTRLSQRGRRRSARAPRSSAAAPLRPARPSARESAISPRSASITALRSLRAKVSSTAAITPMSVDLSGANLRGWISEAPTFLTLT